jgi:RNA polymerase sigma-70 factor (ECF subfamily)
MNGNQNHDQAEALALAAVGRVLDGDTEAFAVILRAYERLVAADLARRLPAGDVQEVAQDAFVRLYRSLPSYQRKVPLRNWVLTIARHAAMDFWRRKYRNQEMPLGDLGGGAEAGDDGDAGAAAADAAAYRAQQEAAREDEGRARRREWLEAALAHLSPDDRAVITLVELEERSMEEAARELGCGLSAVKVRAFRARHRLKHWLEKTRKDAEA